MKYYIGWDVGAWHCEATGTKSKDALAILDESLRLRGTWEGNLSETILDTASNADPTKHFVETVFSLCKVKESSHSDPGTELWLAIDTPLGWPTHFSTLICPGDKSPTGAKVDLSKKKIHNPFLHRKTEVALGQSLSAVQDQIGSQSTKALYLLQALGVDRESTGVWKTRSCELTILETYPAPCMRSLTFLERMKGISTDARIASGDKFDALVCALLASEFARDGDNLVMQPTDDCDEDEGWIFTPKDCLPSANGISYEKLLGSQSPPKKVAEVLSQVQIGIVLKAAIKQAKNDELPPQEIDGWLEGNGKQDTVCQNITAAGLLALFRLLHPTVKQKKFPAESLLKDTADRIAKREVVAEGQTS